MTVMSTQYANYVVYFKIEFTLIRLGATPQHGVTTCPTHLSCTMKLQTEIKIFVRDFNAKANIAQYLYNRFLEVGDQ